MNSIGILFAFLLMFAVFVALIRWALRVNDIVQRLDKIVEILNAK
jgi:Fe2+ transport system protein B